MQHFGHGDGGRHQQALVIDEVHRRSASRGDVGLHGQFMFLGPFFGCQEHGGGAVGQRRAVAGRQCGVVRFREYGPQSAQFFQAAVAADIVIAADSAPGRDDVVEKPLVIGAVGLDVALHGEAVLFLARNAPLSRHALAVLPHRQACAWLAVGGQHRFEFSGAETLKRLQALFEGAGCPGLDQAARKFLAEGDGRIGRRVGTGGDAALDLPRCDLGANHQRGLQAGAASLLQRDTRRQGRQGGGQQGFPRQVPVLRMGSDSACDDLIQLLAVQSETVDQALQAGRQHVEIAFLGIHGVGAAEGNPAAADHGNSAQRFSHCSAPVCFPNRTSGRHGTGRSRFRTPCPRRAHPGPRRCRQRGRPGIRRNKAASVPGKGNPG